MAYLLDRDPLNGEGGKIVFEGHELAKVENVHVEINNREELKLDDLKLPKLNKIDYVKLSATGTVKVTPEINDWFKDMEALAIVETWRRLKKDLLKKNPLALHHVRGIVLFCTNATKGISFSKPLRENSTEKHT